MKVTQKPNSHIQNAATKKAGVTSSLRDIKGDNKASAVSSADLLSSSAKVDVSPRAKEFSRIKELASQAPDVDEAKVAKFQDLIDKGLYKVDAEAVADRLVDAHVRDAFDEGE